MGTVVIGCIVFCITTAASITLLGDRTLLAGNLCSVHRVLEILFHWKFIVSMCCALLARVSFMAINNALISHPTLGASSTNVTTFITASAYVVVVLSNWYFLGEQMSLQQGVGAALIVIGITVLVR